MGLASQDQRVLTQHVIAAFVTHVQVSWSGPKPDVGAVLKDWCDL